MRNFLLSAILTGATIVSAQAQTIQGSVISSVGSRGIFKAQVTAQSFRDTSAHFTTITDSNGKFTLLTKRGMYRLIIRKEGYTDFKAMAATFRGDTNFGIIVLIDTSKRIGEVVVNAQIPPATQKGDTTEYNAAAYKTNPDATAEDLLKKMPGMTVQNGQVNAQGEQVKKVTVDGKDWFGDDAQAVLRNLPADVVDKMQVFDRMSDQSQFSKVDDGTGSKSINIVTKKGMTKGSFGKAYAGYGTNDRYQGGFNYNNFNQARRFSILGMINNTNQQNFTSQDLLGLSSGSGGYGGNRGGGMMGGGGYSGGMGMMGGQNNFQVQQSGGISTTRAFGFNYTDNWGKKTQVAASYFLNSTENLKNSDILRNYINNLNPELAQNYRETSANTNKTYNHRINLRLTYAIDTSNTILYTPRFSWQGTNLMQDYHAGYAIKENPLNQSSTLFNNKGNGYSLNNTLLYMHKFKKAGRTFSVNFSHELNGKENNTSNDNTNYYYTPTDTNAYYINQRSKNLSPSMKWNTRWSYVEPLSKRSSIQLEYAYNYTRNESDKRTYNYDSASNSYSRLDTNLTNIFNYHFSTQQAGIMYLYRDEKLNIGAGGNFQQFQLQGEQEMPYFSPVTYKSPTFLPRAWLSYKISKSASLRAFTRTSTNAPSISQLQSVIDNSNPLLLTTGNPNLQQEVSRFGVVRYSKVNVQKGRNFFVGMMGYQTSNYITNKTTFFQKDSQLSETFTAVRGSQITSPVNLQGYYNLRLFGNYGFPIKLIKSNLNLNGAYSFTNTPGLINGVSNTAATQNYNAGLVLSSNISENLDFTVSYSGNYYTTSNTSQTSLNNQYYNHLASAKLNWILAKKFVLNSEWNYTNYSGLSSGYNQTFMLWNNALAYKFLKNNAAELRLSVFDMLKQNQSIARTTTETYIEDNRTKVLTRYYMLTFTYNLRKFAMPPAQQNQAPGGFGPPPGGPPPH